MNMDSATTPETSVLLTDYTKQQARENTFSFLPQLEPQNSLNIVSYYEVRKLQALVENNLV
jgi:hypothetical protein